VSANQEVGKHTTRLFSRRHAATGCIRAIAKTRIGPDVVLHVEARLNLCILEKLMKTVDRERWVS
jgi:hypothetical protein